MKCTCGPERVTQVSGVVPLELHLAHVGHRAGHFDPQRDTDIHIAVPLVQPLQERVAG
jgi:hypothetical protein